MNKTTTNPPTLHVVDTNVPKTSNLALDPDQSQVPLDCVLACIKAIQTVINHKSLVLDAGDEIFKEYLGQLNLSGQPGLGDEFIKWVHDHRYSLPESQSVTITPSENSYKEFPSHHGLSDFDPSDRKFVAVANAHPSQPPILQAADSKWWGWHDALNECGLSVDFLCPEYIKSKYEKKMKP